LYQYDLSGEEKVHVLVGYVDKSLTITLVLNVSYYFIEGKRETIHSYTAKDEAHSTGSP